MRSKTIIGIIFCLLILPVLAWAEAQSLTMSWNITDTSGISGYKMYFAYDAQMTNKTLACENYDTPATRTSLTCTFDVGQYPFYVQIAAVKSDGSPEIASVAQTIERGTLAPVREFALVTDGTVQTPPPTEGTSYAINFQPATAAVPDGFQADSGAVFSDTAGYGWAATNTNARDRDNTISPDQSYDTLTHVNPSEVWEIAVPNGTYQVTVCVGDPSWPDTSNSVQAEGTAIISNGVINSDQPWIEQTATVTVSDGRITVTFTGSDPQAKLCWIKITSS